MEDRRFGAGARYNLIARPNDWAKAVKETTIGSRMSQLNLEQQAFYERLRDYAEVHAKAIKNWPNPGPRYWYAVPTVTSKANISTILNSRQKCVGVEFHIYDDKELFAHLLSQRGQIERELGFSLDWQERPNIKASRIFVTKSGDFQDDSQADELISWLCHTADKFAQVFPRHL
jgi:hypothetical protein